MEPIYDLQAEILKTLANPRRLEIAHLLADGPLTVSQLVAQLGIAQPNVSQHLALMRSAGVLESERDGREIRYRLADADFIVACGLMRAALQRRLVRLAALSTSGRSAPTPAVAGHR
ncbi:MAG TPA: metalloregulator ArsR/SmtB family transcription factor [Candidatus Limnocylindria bacterium]